MMTLPFRQELMDGKGQPQFIDFRKATPDDINAVMSMVQRGKGYALGPVSFSSYFGVAAIPLEPEM